ncbi:MAG: zinc-dependent metalloprotease [Deltaproteobacteria bacterium]|nr:zinc-dependent metalloprotease [Deltaproteobacteria bacterium]
MKRLSIGLLGLFLCSSSLAHAQNFAKQFALTPPSQFLSGSVASKSAMEMSDDLMLSLDRALLEAPLLFLPTVVTDSTPTGVTTSFGAKQVFFREQGSSVFLMQPMEGHSVIAPYQPEKIIAEFPVREKTADRLLIDFKKGFENLIIQVPASSQDDWDIAAPVTASYLRDPIAQDDVFGFYHVAQLGGGYPATVTLSYAFMPDREPSFDPVRAPEEEPWQVGYFLSPPVYKTGSTEAQQFIARWDTTQPIIFSISPNTPKEFRHAIRDGIEAWNDAFGRRVVQAKIAPEGTLIGDPRYNVFQWLDAGENAVLARADWHLHPMSSEVLHGNVIFFSGWAVANRRDAERMLKFLEATKGNALEEKPTSPLLGLKGFETASLCEGYEPDASMTAMLSRMASGEIPENRILPLMQRVVKGVAMHEIGHVLGLRHNFGGSLSTQIASQENKRDVDSVIMGGKRSINGLLPSSSVMDYLIFEDEIRMEGPGEYDRAAIRWGYAVDDEKRKSMYLPVFCTDEDTLGDADCQRYDAGIDPIVWRATQADYYVDLFNRELLEDIQKPEEKKSKKEIERDWLYRLRWNPMLVGLMRYLVKDFSVRDIGGKRAQDRRLEAAKKLAPYLWVEERGEWAPISQILRSATLARLQSQPSEQDDKTMMRLETMISTARHRTVEVVLKRLSNLRSHLAPDALSPLYVAFAGLAGNAGVGTWMADDDDARFAAASFLMSRDNEKSEAAREKLIAQLKKNISYFESQQMPDEVAFEKQLLTFILLSNPSRRL